MKAGESTTIYVGLLDEGVEVWRPVEAELVRDGLYRIVGTKTDPTEHWAFATGQIVRCMDRQLADGVRGLVAVEAADK
jgi:hypothetical protein